VFPATRRIACVLWLAAAGGSVFGQSLYVGVRGGLRTTGDFQGDATSESRAYVAGPAVAVALPHGFGLEFDALYRRQGFQSAWSTPVYSASTRDRDNVWEFPLLARYRVPLRGIKAYAEVGWAPRIMRGAEQTTGRYLSNIDPTTYATYNLQSPTSWPSSFGVVAGGGVEIGFGHLRLSPEVRYTHWNRQAIGGFYSDGPSYGDTRDQVDVLVGVSWGIAGKRRAGTAP